MNGSIKAGGIFAGMAVAGYGKYDKGHGFYRGQDIALHAFSLPHDGIERETCIDGEGHPFRFACHNAALKGFADAFGEGVVGKIAFCQQ